MRSFYTDRKNQQLDELYVLQTTHTYIYADSANKYKMDTAAGALLSILVQGYVQIKRMGAAFFGCTLQQRLDLEVRFMARRAIMLSALHRFFVQ